MLSRRNALAAATVLLAGALYAAWQMQVASWDVRNYHLYVAWAWLHGRLAHDVAAAQVQTFYNPALLLWFPWAARVLPAVATLALLGAIQACNALLLYRIARETLDGPRWLCVLVAFAGVTAATQLAEMGTTNGDNLVSIPLLGAVALLVRASRQGAISGRASFLAGALLGAAAGLKLASAPCALGVFVAALLLPLPHRARHLASVAIGGALAFALVLGPWAYAQYERWGDPLYPMLGQWLDAPLAIRPAPRELRFLPHGAIDWLAHPLAGMWDWHRTSDLRYRDLRLPLAWLVVPLALVVATLRGHADRTRAALPWLAGALVAIAAWLALFGYERYVLTLEMLAPLAIALAWSNAFGARAVAALVAVLVAAIATTNPPNLGTLQSRVQPIYAATLPTSVPLDGATVLVAGDAPLAFVALALPRDARMVRVDSNFHGGRPGSAAFDAYVARELAQPAARHAALFQAPIPTLATSRIAQTGFAIDTATCGRVASPLLPQTDDPVWLCVARRAAR